MHITEIKEKNKLIVGRNSRLVNCLHSLGVLPYVQVCLWSLAECTDVKGVPRKWISRTEYESATFYSQSCLFSVACEQKQNQKQPQTKQNEKEKKPQKNPTTITNKTN